MTAEIAIERFLEAMSYFKEGKGRGASICKIYVNVDTLNCEVLDQQFRFLHQPRYLLAGEEGGRDGLGLLQFINFEKRTYFNSLVARTLIAYQRMVKNSFRPAELKVRKAWLALLMIMFKRLCHTIIVNLSTLPQVVTTPPSGEKVT